MHPLLWTCGETSMNLHTPTCTQKSLPPAKCENCELSRLQRSSDWKTWTRTKSGVTVLRQKVDICPEIMISRILFPFSLRRHWLLGKLQIILCHASIHRIALVVASVKLSSHIAERSILHVMLALPINVHKMQ